MPIAIFCDVYAMILCFTLTLLRYAKADSAMSHAAASRLIDAYAAIRCFRYCCAFNIAAIDYVYGCSSIYHSIALLDDTITFSAYASADA